MTQDQIIEMARQAGICTWLMPPVDVKERLEAFAKLVAAKERESIIEMIPGGSSVDPQWLCDQIRARGEA
jgi:hypothetical protein